MNLLIIEDNIDLCANVRDFLENRGHKVDASYDGLTGLTKASTENYDVIVLDLVLPRVDGLEVCRRLRNEVRTSTPILMLTASHALENKLRGFASGIDDYLVKPFALEELEARIHALTRRGLPVKRENVLRVSDLSMSLDTLEVQRSGQTITLSPMDLRILKFLMLHTSRVVSRKELEQLIWEGKPPGSDVLRVHIHHLRSAIDKPFHHPLIRTVHGIGYRLFEAEQDEF